MIGETVGDYRITAALGVGGVGDAFIAEHAGTGDKVTLEIVTPQIASNADVIGKYLAGMQKLVTVKHGGLVKVIDAGMDGAGRAYVVTAPIEGETLAKRIETQGKLTVAQVGDIAKQLANALAAIHDEDMVHGDIKPTTIYLAGPSVKITEVGAAIAKRACGIMMGPVYTAPEVWSANATDWRIDAYALGCVMFEMVTGKPPYIGSSPQEVRAKHLSARAPSARDTMPEVPMGLDVMLGRLISKAPEDRFGSMREIARAIDAVMAGAARASAPTVDTPVFKGESEVGATSGVMSGELKARTPKPQPAMPKEPEAMGSIIAEGAVVEAPPQVPAHHLRPRDAADTSMVKKQGGGKLGLIIALVVLLGGGIALVLATR